MTLAPLSRSAGLRRLLPDPGPGRPLALSTLVNTLGNGLLMPTMALFLTRSVGLSAVQVGVGLSIAGAAGLLAGLPAGYLADRVGPRGLLVTLNVLAGVTTSALALVHSLPTFLLVATVDAVFDSGGSAVRAGLVAGVLPAAGRVRTQAYLRSVTNLGIAVGAAGAGIGLHYDTRAAYVTLILLDAVTFVVAGLGLLGVPRVAPHPRPPEGPRMPVLRDRSYLAVTALNSVLAIHYGLLEIGVPLWIAERTSAPHWSVAAVFGVNTVMCVLFQVRVSRGTEDVTRAATLSRRGGLLLAASCGLFAAAAARSAAVALVVLGLAALVQVLGEMSQASGSWGVAFGLAPDAMQGQYQGIFSSGFAVSRMLAPLVVTTLAVSWGVAGWLVLAALFAAAGTALVPVTRWAASAGPRAGRPPAPDAA